MRYENLSRYTNAEFKRLVGVTVSYSTWWSIFWLWQNSKKKSGRPHSLSLADQLLLTLNYLRCYKTQIQLAADYNLVESNVNRTISKVENALIRSGRFSLPKRHIVKSALMRMLWYWMWLNVRFERPKKSSRDTIAVRRKRHSLKIQVVYHLAFKQIMSIVVGRGRHDLSLQS